MRLSICIFLLFCLKQLSFSQSTFPISVQDSQSKSALAGVTVSIPALELKSKTDEKGQVFFPDIAPGSYAVEFRYLGYRTHTRTIDFPISSEGLVASMEAEGEEMEAVVISTTRSSRSIENIPTRVEFIAGEELEEKGNMKPGDIRMMLNESTGIQTQQVSATSANSSIRIQGLDGRYTQLLKDGFPLFGGFSGGLGLLQTPPLDLKQVEIIKGASSTLYGGGAIAGLVNLISKVPTEERSLDFLINGTSAGGLDVNGFYAQQFRKVGLTVFASRNTSAPYDPSEVGFTAIPRTERYVFNPKVFLNFTERTRLSFGLATTFEDRTGGDIQYVKGNGSTAHSYFEKNKSKRVSS